MKMGLDRKTHRHREETMARKRNQEYHKQLLWNDIKKYYKIWELQANKYTLWASQPHSHQSRMEGRQKLLQLELKDLPRRRAKLATLLIQEEKLLDKESKKMLPMVPKIGTYRQLDSENRSPSLNLGVQLKDNGNHLDKTSIRENQIISLHPPVGTTEPKVCQNSLKKCFIEQTRKQDQNGRKEALMQKISEENKQQLMFMEEKEVELAHCSQDDMRQLEGFLSNQIQEVKEKDILTLELKRCELHEMKLKSELENLAFQWNQMEIKRKKRDLRSSLDHQYQLLLKKRTKKIQEQLDEDLQLIDKISKCLEQEDIENSHIQEQIRQELDRANTMLTNHMHLEKKREQEMSFIFFEEARSMWQKQEASWNAEQEARNDMMRNVLVTIQRQVKEKLQNNAEKHRELTNEKEKILKNIEDLNQQMRNHKI